MMPIIDQMEIENAVRQARKQSVVLLFPIQVIYFSVASATLTGRKIMENPTKLGGLASTFCGLARQIGAGAYWFAFQQLGMLSLTRK